MGVAGRLLMAKVGSRVHLCRCAPTRALRPIIGSHLDHRKGKIIMVVLLMMAGLIVVFVTLVVEMVKWIIKSSDQLKQMNTQNFSLCGYQL